MGLPNDAALLTGSELGLVGLLQDSCVSPKSNSVGIGNRTLQQLDDATMGTTMSSTVTDAAAVVQSATAGKASFCLNDALTQESLALGQSVTTVADGNTLDRAALPEELQGLSFERTSSNPNQAMMEF